MADLLGLGTGLFGGLVNGIQNAINYNSASALAHQARHENYMYGEMAANEADMRTRRLYEDYYSPAALLKQYAEAGLSPSLMMGGTPGQGGMSGAQGGGASGPQAAYMPMSYLEAAQGAALMAQANKTNAEAETIKGENPRGWAEIAEINAGVLNKEAQTKLLNAQKTGQELQNYITDNSKEGSIYMICALAEKAGHDAETAYQVLEQNKVITKVSKETVSEQIKLKKKEVEALAQSIQESKSLQHLNEEKKRQVHNEILQAWEQIEINWGSLDVEKQQAETYTTWINEQIPIIKDQLKLKFKELDIEETRMIIDAVTETIKGLAFGAMAAAQFKGGNPTTTNPAVLKPRNTGKVGKYDKSKPPFYKTNTIYGL